MPSSDSDHLADAVRGEARRLGFDLVGVAPAVSPTGFEHLQEWLRRGYSGEMQYIPRREDAYRHPSGVLPDSRSVIVVALNYHVPDQDGEAPSGDVETNSSEVGEEPGRPDTVGRVARYARGEVDYHDVLKKRLKQLAKFLHELQPGCRTRPVVDTAPLLERDFGLLAGLGWFGKNTMLISRQIGSWFFLGALLTDIELTPDEPHHTSHCGTCTRCLDACPTDAFPEPGVLDARRCISYLTIELRDQPIPEEFHAGIGDWVFGCDVCQEVCPWNRMAPDATVQELQPQNDLVAANLDWLLSLDEESFRARFRKTPLFRTGREALARNAAIVTGNQTSQSPAPGE